MAWYDFLQRDAYQKLFERARFERETEPKETWLTRAYETFRKGVEAAQRAPAPPTAEQLGTGTTEAAERLRETAGGLGIERLAGTATELELRRARGQAPAQATAGFPYEEETMAARGRLTESLREQHPEWSEDQLHFAATSAVDPGEGFMPMAAWGLAMRPALAAMAATSVKAAGPAARLTATQAKQLIPRAKDVLMEEAGGLKPKMEWPRHTSVRGEPVQPVRGEGTWQAEVVLSEPPNTTHLRILQEAASPNARTIDVVGETHQIRFFYDSRTAAQGAIKRLKAVVGEPAKPPTPTAGEALGGAKQYKVKPPGITKSGDEWLAFAFDEQGNTIGLKTYRSHAQALKYYKQLQAEHPGISAEAARPPTPTAGAAPKPSLKAPDMVAQDELLTRVREAAQAGRSVGREAEQQLAQLERRLVETPPNIRDYGGDLGRFTPVLEGHQARIAEVRAVRELARGARPAPKPAAQAFREATEIPRLEEAPAWELGGMGTMEEMAAPTRLGAGRRPPPRKPPTAEGVPPAIPPEDPVNKLTQLIRAAKPVRAETEAMRHVIKGKQAAQLREIWAKYPGPEGLRRAKGALKGELPSAKFEPPRLKMTPDDIYELHARAARADIQEFQKLNLKEALEKVLRGEQPTWGEISKLESIFGRQLGKALEAQMPLGKRAWREFWELTGIPRAVQTSFDMSFHLRQGVLLTPRHLKEAGQAFKQAGRALRETNAKGRVAYWEQMKKAGEIPDNTFIAKFGEAAAFQERAEPFLTRWADRIPGIRISERVFATGGNEMRGQIARTLKQTWERGLGRTLTSEESKWVGRLVNYGTGRGPLPDNLRQVLGGIFYAPGFRSSKPAFVSLLLNPSTPAFVRGMVAQELVTFVGAGMATLTVLKMSGAADVELDPRSSDWGKIRVGEMRMDFWGGNQQIARSIAQLITGQRKTLSTQDIMGIERRHVPTRYLEGGLSPQASIALDLFRGETFMGEQLKPEMETARGQFWNRMAPMGIQDIVEAVRTEKAIGAIAAPFAFLGVGVYAPDLAGAKVNELCRQYDPEGRRKQEMTSVEFKRLADEHPDLAAAYEKQIKQASDRGADWAEFKEAQDEADTQVESEIMDALANPQGRTWQDISDGLGDYFRERAIRNNMQYADLESDPRGELGRKIDDYYAVELPRFATEEQRTAFFNEREVMLEADPDLAAAILDNQVLRFSDPVVRNFIRLRWEAQQVATEYYSIPYKARMSGEQQNQVRGYVEQAQDIARMQGVSFRRALMQTDIPTELIGIAMRYKRLPINKARERFWRQNRESEELYRTFYGEIPLGIPVEAEPEMAGVGG